MMVRLVAVALLATASMAKEKPQRLEVKYEDPRDGPMRIQSDLDLTMVIDEEMRKLMTPEQIDELEQAAFQETVRQSRGGREEQGVRDQWVEGTGVGRKEDLQRKMTKKTSQRLMDHGLECRGCTNAEAIEVINDFVRREQRRIQNEEHYAERRRKFMSFFVPFTGSLLLLGISFLVLQGTAAAVDNKGARKVDDEIRDAIRKTQFYAEAMKAAKGEALKPAPTWRDNEELEEWSPRQEKQFQKALGPLMGLPPKERWRLVAEKVEDKTFKECAAHYKLQQILAAEAAS